MEYILNILLWIVVAYLIYRIIRWLRTKQTRYIPKEVKHAVISRYYGMCAVCPENNKLILEFHHRNPVSNGGLNTEQNIVPLCPYHHALITRYPPTTNHKPKGLYTD